jgi:hypothetical protein
VGVFGTSTFPGNTQQLKEAELAAGGIQGAASIPRVLDPKDIETAVREASKGRAEAVLMLGGPVLNSQRMQLADLAVKSRFPAIYNSPEYVEAGGLMTYSVSPNDWYRRALRMWTRF